MGYWENHGPMSWCCEDASSGKGPGCDRDKRGARETLQASAGASPRRKLTNNASVYESQNELRDTTIISLK